MDDSPSTGRERRPPTLLAVCMMAAPWLWFVVRRAGGTVDIVAVALPGIGVGALVALGALAAIRHRLLPLLAGFSIFAACATATSAPRIPRHGPAPARAVRIALANVYRATRPSSPQSRR